MSDEEEVLTLEEFTKVLTPRLVSKTRAILGVTRKKFKDRTGVDIYVYMNEIIEVVYDICIEESNEDSDESSSES